MGGTVTVLVMGLLIMLLMILLLLGMVKLVVAKLMRLVVRVEVMWMMVMELLLMGLVLTCPPPPPPPEEYEVDELPDSHFSKSAMIVLDKKDNGKDGALPLSKFIDVFEKLEEGFHSKELVNNLQKVEPN